MSSQDDGLARSGGQDDELARGLGGLDRGDRLELVGAKREAHDEVLDSGTSAPSPRPHASTQLSSRRRGRLRHRSAPGPTRSSTAPTGGGGSCGDGRARCEAGRLRTFPVRTSRPAPWAWPCRREYGGSGRRRPETSSPAHSAGWAGCAHGVVPLGHLESIQRTMWWCPTPLAHRTTRSVVRPATPCPGLLGASSGSAGSHVEVRLSQEAWIRHRPHVGAQVSGAGPLCRRSPRDGSRGRLEVACQGSSLAV